MSRRSEIREFLVSRRARITPEQAGLPDYGAHRRGFPASWAASQPAEAGAPALQPRTT